MSLDLSESEEQLSESVPSTGVPTSTKLQFDLTYPTEEGEASPDSKKSNDVEMNGPAGGAQQDSSQINLNKFKAARQNSNYNRMKYYAALRADGIQAANQAIEALKNQRGNSDDIEEGTCGDNKGMGDAENDVRCLKLQLTPMKNALQGDSSFENH